MEKRIRLASVSLVIAGILFVLYPAIRPFSDETSLVGAAAFASPAWIVSHVLAIVAFTLLGAGLLGLYLLLQNGSCGRLALRSIVVTWLGIGLTLPFYGAEVFGLHALGKRALAEQSAEWIALADDIRYGSGFLMILAGLLLIGIGSILVVMVIWKSGALPKWAGVLFTMGFLLYLPQFLGTQPLRVAHGVLVAAGCMGIAAGLWRLRGRGKVQEPSEELSMH